MHVTPVQPTNGTLWAADADHLWLSDYKDFATYEPRSGRWTTVPLPYRSSRLTAMNILGINGHAFALMQHCDRPCASEDEGLHARLVLFELAAPRHLRRVPLDGPAAANFPGEPIPFRFGADNDAANFGVNAGDRFILIQIGSGRATSAAINGRFVALCPRANDFIGIQFAEPGTPGAIPFELPPGTSEQGRNAVASIPPPGPLRLVTGSYDGSLEPLEVPAPARSILADQLWLGIACFDDGLALVGHTAATELHGDRWSVVASMLTREPAMASANQIDPLPDGTLIAHTGNGVLVRDPNHGWQSNPLPGATRIAMGDDVITYALPTAPPASSTKPIRPKRKVP